MVSFSFGTYVTCRNVLPADPQYKGAGLDIVYGYHQTDAGEFFIAVSGDEICYTGFQIKGGKKDCLGKVKSFFPKARFHNDNAATKKSAEQIKALWQGKNPKGDKLKLVLHGTDMQTKVWHALLNIPHGETVTYKDIATQIGRPKAARPVGNAVGANPITLVVPCHRVLPQSGKVGNYGWGPAVKKKLLEIEGVL